MLIAIIAITTLGAVLGTLLGLAGKFFAVEDENPLVAEVTDLMPGSQCGQCGYAGCAVGAKAIVDGEAPITLCPPGGRTLVESIATVLGVDPSSVGEVAEPQLASVDASLCVGCTKCLKACPTDAIVGATGQIHAVISSACTGCKKCLSTCAENCITMVDEPETLRSWHWPKPEAA